MNMTVIVPVVVVAVLALGAAVIVGVVQERADCERIREDVEATGGTVLNIAESERGSANDRCYDVTYTTPKGEKHTATCETSMVKGVRWIADNPPGIYSSSQEQSPEYIRCPACGAIVPRVARCTLCGRQFDG